LNPFSVFSGRFLCPGFGQPLSVFFYQYIGCASRSFFSSSVDIFSSRDSNGFAHQSLVFLWNCALSSIPPYFFFYSNTVFFCILPLFLVPECLLRKYHYCLIFFFSFAQILTRPSIRRLPPPPPIPPFGVFSFLFAFGYYYVTSNFSALFCSVLCASSGGICCGRPFFFFFFVFLFTPVHSWVNNLPFFPTRFFLVSAGSSPLRPRCSSCQPKTRDASSKTTFCSLGP